jgi:branched-chain amino acid transport system substrate-binding protein
MTDIAVGTARSSFEEAGHVVTPTNAAQHGRRLAAALALLALAALPALTGCTGSSASAGSKDPLTIGASLSLTGGDAEIGKVYQDALKLEVDLLNAKGAVPGRQIKLSIKDDGSNPTTAAANIKAFQSDDTVAAVVTGPCDDCVTQAAGQIDKSTMPVISLAPSSPPATAMATGTSLFKLTPNASDSVQTLVGQVSANNATSMAVVAQNGAYGDAAAAASVAAGKKAGIKVATPVRLGSAPDAAVQTVLANQEKMPDAVVVIADPTDAASVASGLSQNGYHGGVYLDSVAADSLFLAGNATAENNAYLVYPQVMAMDDLVASTPAKASQKQWFDNYTSQYGSYAGPSSFAADAVQLIGMAATASRSVDRGKLRAAIETTSFAGLTGIIQFTPANHAGLNPRSLVLLRAVNGRWHQTTAG